MILVGRITSLTTEKVGGFCGTLINKAFNRDDITSIIVGAGLVGPGAATLGVPKRRSGGSDRNGSALHALLE